MREKEMFDVVIIGASYAGLSAGMSLGRSMRKVLIVDSGNPCNKYVVSAHNLVGFDGCSPEKISDTMKAQVLAYPTISIVNDLVTSAARLDDVFGVGTANGKSYRAKRLIFATGVIDEMPDLDGFRDCWGKSVLHCPYCHGYEARDKRTAILASGNTAFELAEMISHWSRHVTVVSDGEARLEPDQRSLLDRNFITVVEDRIVKLQHQDGYLFQIVFDNGSIMPFEAAYARPFMKQQCALPELLGCQFHDSINIQVDRFQQTTVEGIFAVGDNCSALRSLANAIAQGSVAGAYINKELIHEQFFNRSEAHSYT